MKIDFYCAKTEQSLQEAFSLVRDEYRKQGYVSDDAELSLPRYNLLPTSRTFVAKSADTVIGMITLVIDGDEGLPMESIYRDEVSDLRKHKGRIAEISQLALKRDFIKSFDRKFQAELLFSLFRLVYFFAKTKAVETLCITINPKHESFYNSLGFRDLGELKLYPLVNNAPALAKLLDLERPNSDEGRRNFVFQEILKKPVSSEDFQRAELGEPIYFLEN